MRYKDTSKADAMHHHIQACQAGTQSVEQYCQQQGIKISEHYGKYSITMCYDNEYKAPNREDF